MDLSSSAATAIRLCLRGLKLASRGLAWMGSLAKRHRHLLVAVGVRIAWCVALWLIVEGAQVLLDVRASVDVSAMLTRFCAGLGLCWVVVILASERRLRWASVALGTAHGGLGLLLWTVTGGQLPS